MQRGTPLVIAALALLGLTALSFALASLASLGAAGPPVALAIASVKVVVVAAVFMELRHAGPSVKLAALVTISFVFILCIGVVADVAFR